MASGKRVKKPSEKAVAATATEPPAPKRGPGRPRKNPSTKGKVTANSDSGDDIIELLNGKEAKKKAKTRKRNAKAVDFSDAELPAEPKVKKRVVLPTAKKLSLEDSQLGDSDTGKGDEDEDEDAFEPTDDTFAETLAGGIADGTLRVDEWDEEVDEDEGDSILGPVTSTPFPRKPQSKGRKTVGRYDVKVSVHDGLGMRTVSVSTKDDLRQLLEKIATAMKRPNNLVEMGYEAPWSSKIGSKKQTCYISNNEELDEFWVSFHGYVQQQRRKKKGPVDGTVSGIVFRNMMDSSQAHTRAGGRAKEPAGAKAPKAADPLLDARDSAESKIKEATKRIQAGMFCKKHACLCYKKFRDECGTYTADNVLEHATLLARNEPGVVPDEVPDSLGSKLLDYIRSGKRSGSAAPIEAAEEPQSSAVVPVAVETRRIETPSFTGPLDFPAIATWLRECEDHLERGRDSHKYTKLLDLFADIECTRIDDITHLSTDVIRMMAAQGGLEVLYGLVNRVLHYASEDVAKVRKFGKLKL